MRVLYSGGAGLAEVGAGVGAGAGAGAREEEAGARVLGRKLSIPVVFRIQTALQVSDLSHPW